MEALNFEKEIQIDHDKLDIEWLEQPSLTAKYGKNLRHLDKKVRIAEENVKVVRSELTREANENPTDCCNKAKPNAGDIEAYYRVHKKYKEAKEEVINTQEERDLAEVAYYAIRDRKYALQDLVKMHGQMYFAGPSVPRDLQKEVESHEQSKRREEKNLSSAGKGMKRKKK